MHELAIAEAIFDTVQARAEGRPVAQVDVRIGHLRQVVPDALTFAWEAVTDATPLAGCALCVTHVPAVVVCPCGATTELDLPILQCGTCESFDVTLVSGEEFDLASFDVVRAQMGKVHPTHAGYGESAHERVHVLESLLAENDRVAAANRADLAHHDVWSLNLMSSPGAGKTTLLAATLAALRAEGRRVGVVEGDIETSLDADVLAPHAAAVALVNTAKGFGGECHLDAPMVRHGLDQLDLAALDIVLVENVGNLVCPAEFDVGEHAKAMVFAVTEGEEKPLKYPVMFRAVDVVLLNKIDLLPHLDFDADRFVANVRAVNPRAEVLKLSAKTGEGLAAWLQWLRSAAS